MGVLAGAALEKVGEDSLKPAFQSGSSRPLAEWYGAGVHGGRSSSAWSIPVCKMYYGQVPSRAQFLQVLQRQCLSLPEHPHTV